MGLGTAFRAFFVALGGSDRSVAIRRILDKEISLPLIEQAKANPTGNLAAAKGKSIGDSPKPPPRSEAIDLLAALQRESRLIDLVSEPLDGFSDAQIGAAARPCLKQTAQVLQRMFELTPVSSVAEGSQLELPNPWSPVRYQVIGGNAVASGQAVRVVHPGWQATLCKVPQWTGDAADKMVVAAAQVEVP